MKVKLIAFVILLFSLSLVVSCGPKKLPPGEPPIETPTEPAGEPERGREEEPEEKEIEPPEEERKPPRNIVVTPPERPKTPSKGEPASLKLIEKGVSLMNDGNLADAEQQFEQALRVNPNNGKPYYYLGVVAAKQKDPGRSLNFLERAETFLFDDSFWMSQIYLQQGLALKSLNRKNEARQKFQQALQRDPNNSHAQKELDSLK